MYKVFYTPFGSPEIYIGESALGLFSAQKLAQASIVEITVSTHEGNGYINDVTKWRRTVESDVPPIAWSQPIDKLNTWLGEGWASGSQSIGLPTFRIEKV